MLDYLHEVEHAEARIARLELAVEEAAKSTPPEMKAAIEGLRALRGIAEVAAMTIVAELGEISRFSRARQLMGYGGIAPCEHSSGESNWRGGITKTGSAHLRRVVVEAAWRYRHRPKVGWRCANGKSWSAKKSEKSPGKRSIGCIRVSEVDGTGKDKGKVITAIGRKLLGFIWAIGVKVGAAQKVRERYGT